MSKRQQIGDRFIYKRSNSDVGHFNLTHSDVESLTDFEFEENEDLVRTQIVNSAKKAYNILLYRKKVLSALNINHSRILGPRLSKNLNFNKLLHGISPWPVHARKKFQLRSPEIVFDIEGLESVNINLYRHIIDWGKQGHFATSFNGEVSLWPATAMQPGQTETGMTISNCVKWNRSGNRFAVSRIGSRISIIQRATAQMLKTAHCSCLWCKVTALEWSKNDHVIAGCSTGSLTIIHNDEPIKQFYKLVNEEITDLKLSCYGTYLLVSTLKGNASIFKWPMTWATSRSVVCDVSRGLPCCIKSTAWHPWVDSILVVGEKDNGIAVWNMNNQKLLDFKRVGPYFKETSTCIMDFLTFNPLSAELLISFYHESPDPKSTGRCNFLTVFRDLDTKVDEVRYHMGRVPYVLWDSTGTVLATVDTNEHLLFWDFFGTEEQEVVNRFKKEKKKISDIFDLKLQCGTSIR